MEAQRSSDEVLVEGYVFHAISMATGRMSLTGDEREVKEVVEREEHSVDRIRRLYPEMLSKSLTSSILEG